MPKRRNVLIGMGSVGGAISLAGCSESTPEFTLFIKDRHGEPIEGAEVEIIEEGGFLESDEVVEEGTTNRSGEFKKKISEGEYLVKVNHGTYGSKELDIKIERDFEETIDLLPNLILTVTGSEGEPIGGAEVEIIEERGYSDDSVIQTGTTDESGEFIGYFDESKGEIGRINHPEYFEEEFTITSSEHAIPLSEFDSKQRAQRVTDNILDNQTDYDEVRGINVSETDEGIIVEAESNWMALRSSESAYAGKAADVLEDIFTSDADIHYFEIDLYGPTVDEYGEEGFSRALTVGMYEETANQINWGNYDSDNLSRHADTYNLNFALF